MHAASASLSSYRKSHYSQSEDKVVKSFDGACMRASWVNKQQFYLFVHHMLHELQLQLPAEIAESACQGFGISC